MEVFPPDSPNKLPSPDAQSDNAMDGFEQEKKKKKKKRTAEEILEEEKETGAIRKVRKEDGGVITVKVPNGIIEDEDIPKEVQDTLLAAKGWVAGRCNCTDCRNFRMRAAVKNLKPIPE